MEGEKGERIKGEKGLREEGDFLWGLRGKLPQLPTHPHIPPSSLQILHNLQTLSISLNITNISTLSTTSTHIFPYIFSKNNSKNYVKIVLTLCSSPW